MGEHVFYADFRNLTGFAVQCDFFLCFYLAEPRQILKGVINRKSRIKVMDAAGKAAGLIFNKRTLPSGNVDINLMNQARLAKQRNRFYKL